MNYKIRIFEQVRGDGTKYYNTEKQQVVFTFIPFALVDNPTREVEYDRDFNETRKYVAV